MAKNRDRKAIGIIGGMGPEASRHFYGLLIQYAQKDYQVARNEDFPEIYLASIPVPDFISSQKRREEALRMLLDRIRQLDKLPIGFYCLTCNTGHLLIDKLRQQTDKPFISLLEELPRFLKSQKIKRIGLLASPTTIRTKMYEKPLNNYGINLITPTKGDTEFLGKIILDTVAGKNLEENRIQVQKIARKLLEQGAEGIIEACTEIPIIFPKQHLVPVFDTLEILAQAVLKKYYLLE